MSLREQIVAAGDPALADQVAELLSNESADPTGRWQAASRFLYEHDAGFDTHRLVREACFPDDLPQPMCIPNATDMTESNLGGFLRDRQSDDYAALHRWSITERDEFWQQTIDRLGISFRTDPHAVCDLTAGPEAPAWLPGAVFNIVDSCFQAAAGSPAIVFPGANGLHTISVEQLRTEVLTIAAAIRRLGFDRGSRLAIVMPMIPESVSIYLGIIAAGCVAVSIADSFAAPEIETRLKISDADGIFCLASFARGGRTFDLYSRVCDANAPTAIVIGADELRPGDVDFAAFRESAEPLDACVAADPQQHINILFSSGTTGDPKAIPWPQTVPIKCAADGMWHQDIRPGDVVVWPTNIGWMMGPWLIFAALINKATIGLAPLGDGFGRFVQDAKVTMLGVVPTLVRNWRTSRCMEQFDWSGIRCFSSTGEASSPDDMFYLSWLAGGRPVIEYCGGTEVGGGYVCSTVVQPNVPGCFSTPALGSEFVILDEDGTESEEGELFLVPPAIGLSTELLNRDHYETYYAGTPTQSGRPLRRHGDHFERLPGGFYRAGGRADDTMNLGGIKVSSAEFERVLNMVRGVSETAAVAVPSAGGGPSELYVFVVATDDCDRHTLQDRMTVAIKTQLNPLFRLKGIQFADSLPRTASNKVMRRRLRAQLQEAQESGQE